MSDLRIRIVRSRFAVVMAECVRSVERVVTGSVMFFGLVCGVAAAETLTRPARRPNVVTLFPDQLRWCSVGCYGDAVVRTPAMDRLAAGGVRFTHAFSNFPVCSPARSILLSGRYARSNGVQRNQDREAGPGRPTNRDPTLAEVLAAAGYDTALVGKWHLAPRPQVLGFARSLRPRMRHRYYRQIYYRNEGEPYVVEEYGPHHETEAATAFIRERRDRPFFLFLSLGPPHMPLAEQPDRYRTTYDPARIPLRDNVWRDGRLAFDENWFQIYLWDFQYYEHKGTFRRPLPPGMTLRELTALYYGQITAVDDCIARVLDAIRESGREEDTIVLLTSDHGDLLGSHHLFNKNRHYDEAIRVPLIVRYPRAIRPRVIDTRVVGLVDVMPTLLDLCGVSIPSSVQGRSLASVLRDRGQGESSGEGAAFIETNQEDGVRTLRYLYVIQRRTPHREQLFDVEKDPFEMNDVSTDPAMESILRDLRARVRDWQRRTPAVAAESG